MRANSDRVFAALPHSTEEIEGYSVKESDTPNNTTAISSSCKLHAHLSNLGSISRVDHTMP
jgi:hypothetical protein